MTETPSPAQVTVVEGGEGMVLNEQVEPEEDGTEPCGGAANPGDASPELLRT